MGLAGTAIKQLTIRPMTLGRLLLILVKTMIGSMKGVAVEEVIKDEHLTDEKVQAEAVYHGQVEGHRDLVRPQRKSLVVKHMAIKVYIH